MKDKRVLFMGERIVDLYHYGRLMPRPLKEPIQCIQYESTEAFAGGVTAAAAHARTFVSSFDIASWCEVRKERYLENGHYRKLFEVYSTPAKLFSPVWPSLSDYDLVVVTDYGHGMMDAKAVERVCEEARFLAVNVQTNAGNFGFNLASKYYRADYLCLDESEARLSTGNQNGDIRVSLDKLAKVSSIVAVTVGKRGAVGISKGEFSECSAFTDRIVDTMGAGDAFFSVTSCMAEETPLPELLRVGNAVAALKCQQLGHRNPVTKDALLAYLAR